MMTTHNWYYPEASGIRPIRLSSQRANGVGCVSVTASFEGNRLYLWVELAAVTLAYQVVSVFLHCRPVVAELEAFVCQRLLGEVGTACSCVHFLEDFGCFVGVEASLQWRGVASSSDCVIYQNMSGCHGSYLLLFHRVSVIFPVWRYWISPVLAICCHDVMNRIDRWFSSVLMVDWRHLLENLSTLVLSPHDTLLIWRVSNCSWRLWMSLRYFTSIGSLQSNCLVTCPTISYESLYMASRHKLALVDIFNPATSAS